MIMLLQRMGLFLLGNTMIVLAVMGYQNSIADTILYLANAENGGWHGMAVSAACLIAGNILMLTGAKMSSKKPIDAPNPLSDSLPDKLD